MATAVSPQAAFRFRCLGPVSLRGPDGGDLGLRTRKLIALLLVLAKGAKPMSRDALIELLWSEDSEKKARHSLSQSVSLLNKTLGAEVIAGADRDRLVLRPNHVRLDVTDFERLSSAGEHAEARGLWRGTLLEGVWIQRAPNFERWLGDERQRLERVLRRMVHDLIEERRAEGDYGAMRAEAESLLELDALDEKAMLACLESLQLGGDRTLALRRYGEFEKRLKEELDAEPGSALRGWARRNRKGDSGAGLRYVPIPRISEITVLPSPQPIFGRTEEYAVLWNAWEQATAGKGAFIVLEGEAGIGKTALATKLANQVHVAGGSVCFVRCYRTEKSVPFAPITSLMRQLSHLPGFVGLDPVWIGELTRLVPELRERYPNAPQPMAVDDAARHRLADATVQAAQAVAEEQALLVVVDDLQDADEATLAALHYLGRQAPQQAILFLAACRSAERASGLERVFFEAARRDALARFIPLQVLQSPDVERLVLQVLARGRAPVPEASIATIVLQSAGNPLQAIEAAVAISNGRAVDSGNAEGAIPTESTFEASVTERLGQLSGPSTAVAQAIAVAGRPLSGYELASVTRLPITEMSLAVTELEGQRLLKRAGSSLAFTHERYARAVEDLIEPNEGRRLHLELAQLLRQSAAKNPAARHEVARHYAAAGRRTSARSEALLAAKHARSLGAVRERADSLRLALEASRGFDPRLGAELGECLLDLGDLGELDRLCQLAADAQHVDAESAAAFTYLRIAAALGSGRANLCETAQNLAHLLVAQPRFSLESAARTLLMRAAYRSGDFGTARRAARALRKRASGPGGVAIGHALSATAYVAAKYYAPMRALPLFRLAIEDAQARQDLDLEHLCRQGLGAVNRQLGRFSDAIAEHKRALALARRTLNPEMVVADLSDAAVAEMALGAFERSNELFKEAAAILENQSDAKTKSFLLANHAELYLGVNDLERASGLFETALEPALWLKDLPIAVQALAGLALCSQRLGSKSGLAHWSGELQRVGGGRERMLHERWMAEAALAWDLALNQRKPKEAASELSLAARELRRRDVDHWLLVELELLRLKAKCLGGASEAEMDHLESVAASYEAGTVLRGLKELRT
jgi:DNA-binding SARP family transcriptional activator